MASRASSSSFDPLPLTPDQWPSTPLSASLQALRRDWRMAAVSQFCMMWKTVVKGAEFEIELLEQDLDGTRPLSYVPQLMGKLLQTLGNDNKVTAENWMIALRRQYARRLPLDVEHPFQKVASVPVGRFDEEMMDVDPEEPTKEEAAVRVQAAKLEEAPAPATAAAAAAAAGEGTADGEVKMELEAETSGEKEEQKVIAEEPPKEPEVEYEDVLEGIEWVDVSLETKIAAIHNVCEWHMVEHERFRRLLLAAGTLPEDEVAWRVSPAGYDAKGNKYWLFDDNRLWVQRPAPGGPQPRERNRKSPVKATAAAKSRGKGKGKAVDEDDEDNEEEDAVTPEPEPVPSLTGRNARRAKLAATGPRPVLPPPGREPSRSTRANATTLAPPLTSNGLLTAGGAGKGKKRSLEDALAHSEDRDEEEDAEPETKKGKGKARASSEQGTPPKGKGAVKVTVQQPTPRGTRKARSRNHEVWEEIPEEWLAAAEAESSKDAEYKEEEELSELSSLSESEDEGGSELTMLSSAGDEEDEEEDDEMEQADDDEPATNGASEQYSTKWERQYWAERALIESAPLPEWQAVCITLEEWEAFPLKFEGTTSKKELALRKYIANEVLPIVVADLKAREQRRITEIAIMNRKRSNRIAIKESTKDEEARLQAEQAALYERSSRASRHRVLPEVSTTPQPTLLQAAVKESREDRLRKREEERLEREAQREREEIEEAKAAARAEAIEANGGVVPPEWETPEERAEREAEEDKKKKREQRNARDRARKIQKKAEEAAAKEAAQKAAQLQLQQQAQARAQAGALPAAQASEEPWYLDCEVCGRQGWNQDDGSNIVCCDRCNDWSHIECRVAADRNAGRPVPDYEKIDFVCPRCAADPARGPQTRPPPQPRPPVPMPLAYPAAQQQQPMTNGVAKHPAAAAAGPKQPQVALPATRPQQQQPYPQQQGPPRQQHQQNAYYGGGGSGQPSQYYQQQSSSSHPPPPQQQQQGYMPPGQHYGQPVGYAHQQQQGYPPQQQPGGPQQQQPYGAGRPYAYPPPHGYAANAYGGYPQGPGPYPAQGAYAGQGPPPPQQQHNMPLRTGSPGMPYPPPQQRPPSQQSSHSPAPSLQGSVGPSQQQQQQPLRQSQPAPPPQGQGQAQAPQAQGQAQSSPSTGQPQMTYEALLELVKKDNNVILSLPPQYQEHFNKLLGLQPASSSG